MGFELSRSWITWIVIWVRVESARKNESSTTLHSTQFFFRNDSTLAHLRIQETRLWFNSYICWADSFSETLFVSWQWVTQRQLQPKYEGCMKSFSIKKTKRMRWGMFDYLFVIQLPLKYSQYLENSILTQIPTHLTQRWLNSTPQSSQL